MLSPVNLLLVSEWSGKPCQVGHIESLDGNLLDGTLNDEIVGIRTAARASTKENPGGRQRDQPQTSIGLPVFRFREQNLSFGDQYLKSDIH